MQEKPMLHQSIMKIMKQQYKDLIIILLVFAIVYQSGVKDVFGWSLLWVQSIGLGFVLLSVIGLILVDYRLQRKLYEVSGRDK